MQVLNDNLIMNELTVVDEGQEKQLERIKEMRLELKESMKKREDVEDPDNILYENIERANNILDKLQGFINDNIDDKKGIVSSKMFDAAAQLINAITAATQSIVGSHKDEMEHEYKLQLLELKNKELMVRAALKDSESGPKTVNNNLIISNREQILEIIKNKHKDDIDE